MGRDKTVEPETGVMPKGRIKVKTPVDNTTNSLIRDISVNLLKSRLKLHPT